MRLLSTGRGSARRCDGHYISSEGRLLFDVELKAPACFADGEAGFPNLTGLASGELKLKLSESLFDGGGNELHERLAGRRDADALEQTTIRLAAGRAVAPLHIQPRLGLGSIAAERRFGPAEVARVDDRAVAGDGGELDAEKVELLV